MRGARSRAALLLTLSLTSGLVATGAAAASCGGEFTDLVKDERWVFVGTATQQDKTSARLDVKQVWRGPDLAPTVAVQTGQTQPPWPLSVFMGLSGSGDVALEPGTTYVVALEEDVEHLRTNNCVVAEATKPVLALAPDDVRGPTPGGVSGMRDGPFTPAVAVTAAGLMLAMVFALLVLRRRRRG